MDVFKSLSKSSTGRSVAMEGRPVVYSRLWVIYGLPAFTIERACKFLSSRPLVGRSLPVGVVYRLSSSLVDRLLPIV